MTGAWHCNKESEKGARCYERPIDFSTLNYSRSCEIDAESTWIGLASVKFQGPMGKRVKQDAPDYRASWNPAKKHPDNLSGRLSRAK